MDRIACIVALGAAAGLAHARGGEAFLYLDVTTTDGDDIVLPGEQAFVTMTGRMDWDGEGFPLVAFGGVVVDLVNEGCHGVVVHYEYLNDLGHGPEIILVDGCTIRNVGPVQLDFTGYVTDNPIALFRFTWEPLPETPFGPVTYSIDLSPSNGIVSVLVLNDTGKIVSENWPAQGTGVTFQYVPEPGVIAALALAGLFAARRKSREPVG